MFPSRARELSGAIVLQLLVQAYCCDLRSPLSFAHPTFWLAPLAMRSGHIPSLQSFILYSNQFYCWKSTDCMRVLVKTLQQCPN